VLAGRSYKGMGTVLFLLKVNAGGGRVAVIRTVPIKSINDLCKARDIGLESFLICLEENSQKCTFSVYFGAVHFCQCPLRAYIANKHKN
jgi:hypothetical protein